MVPITDMEQNECPVSLLHKWTWMDIVVQELLQMSWVTEPTGSPLFGTDSSKWPARWYEFVRAAEIETSRVEEAKEDTRKAISR